MPGQGREPKPRLARMAGQQPSRRGTLPSDPATDIKYSRSTAAAKPEFPFMSNL